MSDYLALTLLAPEVLFLRFFGVPEYLTLLAPEAFVVKSPETKRLTLLAPLASIPAFSDFKFSASSLLAPLTSTVKLAVVPLTEILLAPLASTFNDSLFKSIKLTFDAPETSISSMFGAETLTMTGFLN